MLKVADRALVALPMVANPAMAITSQASRTRRLCRRTMSVSRFTGSAPRPGCAKERQRRSGGPACPDRTGTQASQCEHLQVACVQVVWYVLELARLHRHDPA